jgi:hypothetical protein
VSPAQPPTDQVTAAVEVHVREILATAERAAADLQHEVERESLRRAHELRDRAEAEAARIHAEADASASAQLADAHRRIQAFADGRAERLRELSDVLLARAEAIAARLEEAVALQDELRDLAGALQEAAAQTLAEAGRPPVRLPEIAAQRSEATTLPPARELRAEGGRAAHLDVVEDQA